MPVYTIETPTGQKLDIEAANEQAAIAGAQQWHKENGGGVGSASALSSAGLPFAAGAPSPTPAPQVDVATDVAKSVGVGAGKGVMSLPGMIGNVRDMTAQGASKLASLFGVNVPAQTLLDVQKNAPGANGASAPNSADIQKAVEGYTGPFYQPQTSGGKIASGAAEAVANPLSYIGPGGILLKLGMAAGSGAGGEIARQAAEGTKYELPAQIAGSIVGGGTALLPQMLRSAPRAIPAPSRDALQAAYDSDYGIGRASTAEIHPQVMQQMAQRVRSDLYNAGINEQGAPATTGILNRLDESLAAGQPFDMKKMSMLRQELTQARKEGGKDFTAAQTLAGHLDNVVDNLGAQRAYVTGPTGLRIGSSPVTRGSVQDVQDAVNSFRTGDQNYAAAMRSDLVNGKTDAATLKAATENSGLNLENKLRQASAGILANENARRGFGTRETALMNEIARGTALANLNRQIGNRLGGGGGLGGTMLSAVGAATLGPWGSLAGLAGLGLRHAGNMNTLRKAQMLDQITRMNSPLGRSIVQPTAPGMTPGLLPASILRSLATAGVNAM